MYNRDFIARNKPSSKIDRNKIAGFKIGFSE